MTAPVGHIIVQLGEEVVKTVAINAPTITIGRTPDNALVLPHPLISRRHAEIRLDGARIILIDLDSSNGTAVKGARLLPNQPRELSPGDTFQIGPFVLVYAAMGRQEQSEHALPIASVPDAFPTETLLPVLPLSAPRPTFPVPRAHGPTSNYLGELPMIFHDNNFLGRYLLIIETIWEQLERRQDQIAMYFDPRTCPAGMLPWLASWLDFMFTAHWPEERQRRFLAEAVELYRWRGTRYGLERILEVCTGHVPQITELAHVPFVLDIAVTIPPDGGFNRETIEQLVIAHKPAHVGYYLTERAP